jgi:hypothetical protein
LEAATRDRPGVPYGELRLSPRGSQTLSAGLCPRSESLLLVQHSGLPVTCSPVLAQLDALDVIVRIVPVSTLGVINFSGSGLNRSRSEDSLRCLQSDPLAGRPSEAANCSSGPELAIVSE